MNDQFSLEQIAQRELDAGERLLWSGSPNPWSHIRKGLPLFIFSIPWTAFALFWTYGAAGFKVPDFTEPFDFFPLFGVPFILIGIGMMSSPLYYYFTAKRTLYALTTKRAMIIKYGTRKYVKSYTDEDIRNIERKEKADGSGDIVFRQEVSTNSKGHTTTTNVGFFGIQDVRTVEKMLIEQFKK
jgi:hypothetical protein